MKMIDLDMITDDEQVTIISINVEEISSLIPEHVQRMVQPKLFREDRNFISSNGKPVPSTFHLYSDAVYETLYHARVTVGHTHSYRVKQSVAEIKELIKNA